MKQLLSIILIALLCAGCCTTMGERVLPDGQKLSIKNTRFFWASEGMEFSVTDSEGFTTRLSTQKSSVDTAALQTAFSGMADLTKTVLMFASTNRPTNTNK